MRRNVIVAAIVLLAVGSLLAWHVPQPLLPPPPAHEVTFAVTFADVQAAMREQHVVTCLQTKETKDAKQVGGWVKETLYFYILDNGMWRAQTVDAPLAYTLWDGVKHRLLTVDTTKKEATLLLGVNPPQTNLYETLKDLPADVSARRRPGGKNDSDDTPTFEVTWNGRVFDVEVDAKSRLPLRVRCAKDPSGNLAGVYLEQIVFHKEPDPKPLSFEAPAGYDLEIRNVAEPSEGTAGASGKDLIVTPRVGVGDVKFGMTREEVEKSLGEPDVVEEAPKGGSVTLGYYSCGLFISVGKTSGVGLISCLSQPMILVRIRDFPGKTDKGIALGASSADITRAYGEPDGKRVTGDSTSLSYGKLDAEFKLAGDRLVQILLNRPPPEK